jgi:hypothetical protein
MQHCLTTTLAACEARVGVICHLAVLKAAQLRLSQRPSRVAGDATCFVAWLSRFLKTVSSFDRTLSAGCKHEIRVKQRVERELRRDLGCGNHPPHLTLFFHIDLNPFSFSVLFFQSLPKLDVYFHRTRDLNRFHEVTLAKLAGESVAMGSGCHHLDGFFGLASTRYIFPESSFPSCLICYGSSNGYLHQFGQILMIPIAFPALGQAFSIIEQSVYQR